MLYRIAHIRPSTASKVIINIPKQVSARFPPTKTEVSSRAATVDKRSRLSSRAKRYLIVRELDEGPLDAFLGVFLLFHLENELIELLLEGLVRVVDAKLFKAGGGENEK